MNTERHVKIGDKIKIHFSGRLENGEIFDSSEGKEPLVFEVGSGNVIPGIDEAVVGMKINQEKNIYLNPDKAYGPVEKELVISIAKKDLPEKLDVKINQQLIIPIEDSDTFKVRVSNVTEDSVELDGNHPLAGKNLIFDLRLVEFVN